MLTPEGAVGLALGMARDGLAAGEMPIGAVVLDGDRVVGQAYTQEHALRRRIVHADLLAMLAADTALGFTRPEGTLTLVVTLEPCLMCLGAAITLGVERVWYALESPNDGAHELLGHWSPPVEQPFFQRPAEIVGGIRRDEARALFARYADGGGPAGMRAWARSLAGPVDDPATT
jgi:tRNA(adenine34) deaminase